MRRKLKLKFEKDDLSIILKRYILLVIPVIIIFISIYTFVAKVQVDKMKDIIIGEQQQRLTAIDYIVNDKFEEIKQDLFIIKNSDEMYQYINNQNINTLSENEKMIYRISTRKSSFYKIRLIDKDGKEIINVMNTAEGSMIQPKDSLVNISDKYYYDEASKLRNGQVYVSIIDLNKENGQIESPYRPVIRVATSLYSKDEQYQGVLIINYLADEILEIFNENFRNTEFAFVNHYLSNKEGFYLYIEDTDKSFGFMFEDKANENLKYDNSKLWKQIDKDSDIYVDGKEIYYYEKVYPFAKMLGEKNIYWIAVAQFNMMDLPIVDQFIFLGLKVSDLFILLGICALIFISVAIYYYKNKDEEELNIVSMIAENTNDATVITDKDTNIIYVNKAFENTTGYGRDEIIGLKTNYFKSGLQSKDFYKKMWKSINTDGYWIGELWDRKKNGMLYPKKLSILSFRNNNKEVEKYIGIFTELSKPRHKEYITNNFNNYSLDTNFPNEKLLTKLFEHEFKNKKTGVISFSIINYNDILIKCGSETSDHIVNLIKKVQRMIKKDDFVAQLSRNIFTIGISNLKNIDELNRYINNLFDLVEEVNSSFDCLYFDIKAGIAVYPRDGSTSKEIINNANLALEYIISDTEKKYAYYDRLLKENLNKEIMIKSLIRNAIEEDELEVYFQPQVDSRNKRIIGAEALLRWNSKELGFVSPAVFIPIAENIGIIKEIGAWVIDKTFENYNKILDLIDDDFRISINISPIQFRDENLVNRFKDLSAKYKIPLSRFEIEITESVFVTDINMVNDQIKKFSQLGITVAIDDFGTGFSSLTYLKDLTIDKLKIDRSFIKDYPEKDDAVMACVITSMSKKLGLKIIAEGADKKEQVDYLQSVGCNFIQGYYFSKPLPIGDFIRYLDETRRN